MVGKRRDINYLCLSVCRFELTGKDAEQYRRVEVFVHYFYLNVELRNGEDLIVV